MGGPVDRFLTTRWSAIGACASDDPDERRRSFEVIVSAYWKPVYKFIRIKWRKPNEEAKDLTQGFFARALEKGWFATYDSTRSRFRTYLRTCLDGFLSNQDKGSKRLKRGGGQAVLSLDFVRADHELSSSGEPAAEDLDDYFEKEWVRSLFTLAVEALESSCRDQGKGVCYQAFARYDLETAQGGKPTYSALARELGVSVTQVTNHLAFARREFRRILMEKLREVTATQEEFEEEARSLLGVPPSPV